MMRFRDETLQTQFDRSGYVILKLLDDDELEHARSALIEAAEGRVFARNDVEDSYFNSMFECGSDFQARLRTLMADIFKSKFDVLFSGSRIFETSLLYKPDQSRELLIHQHVPLTERPFETSVFCWCPLVDCDETSGALKVVPGSHHILRFLRTLATGEYFLPYRDHITQHLAVPIKLKAGEAVLFENSLLHGAHPNLGSSPRPVVLNILVREDAIHAVYQQQDAGDVAVFDDGFAEIQTHMMMPGAPEHIPGAVLRRLPTWDDKPTLDEFRMLVDRGRRASEDYDPLAELRAERANRSWRRKIADYFPSMKAKA